MLVVTRTIRESIMIGDGIEVTVSAINGDKVRIGIRAPSDVPVHRREVYLAIQEQANGSGAGETPDPQHHQPESHAA